jgi:FkbM family methyltransferase
MVQKLVWGARTVGTGRAVVGVARLLSLKLQRPQRASVVLASGAIMDFAVPSQVAPALVLFRDLIDPEFAFLTRVVDPGWVVLDVGAAIGQFSVFAARLPVRQVHAFEPSPENVSSLRRNLELNDVTERVRVHQLALSDHAGEALFVTSHNTYLSGLQSADAEVDHAVPVPVQTLDETVRDLGLDRVDVLKLNVAGHEADVLAGAQELLRRGGADILVMLIGDRSIPWYERCSAWGYSFFFYHPKRGILLPVDELDPQSLRHPAWPARHLIGVHRDAIARGVLGPVEVALTHAGRAS